MSAGNEREFIDYLQRKEGKTMKCPILPQVWLPPGEKGKWQQQDCIKEECAEWDEVKMCCGRRTLRKQVERLADILLEIKDKMPHAGQFLK